MKMALQKFPTNPIKICNCDLRTCGRLRQRANAAAEVAHTAQPQAIRTVRLQRCAVELASKADGQPPGVMQKLPKG